MKKEFLVDGVRCICYGSSEPSCVLIQGEDTSRLGELDSEVRILEKLTDRPFLLVAFAVDNWNRDYLKECKCSDRNLMNRMLSTFPRKLPVVKRVGRRNVKTVIEECDAYRRKIRRL